MSSPVQAQVLTFLIPGMMAIFSAIFLAFWWQDKAKNYILGFTGWALAFAFAMIMPSLFPALSEPYQALFFHWFIASGMIALIWGIADREGQSVRIWALVVLVTLISPVFYFASLAGQPVSVLLAQDYSTGILAAFALQLNLRSKPRNKADGWLSLILTAIAIYTFARPSLFAFMQSQMTVSSLLEASFAAVNFVIAAMLALMLALCLIAVLTLDFINSFREEAKIDPLTGLPNRAAFETMAEQLLAKASQKGVQVSLLVGDIDHFKRVNDTWGHSAGDVVINAFGTLIAQKIRPHDVAGRIGGEEFCILIWDCSANGAISLGNRLRMAFSSAHIEGLNSQERFSASFGIAQVIEGDSYARVFERADKALYKAKRGGRDRVEAAQSDAELRKTDLREKDETSAQQPDGSQADIVSLAKVAELKSRSKS